MYFLRFSDMWDDKVDTMALALSSAILFDDEPVVYCTFIDFYLYLIKKLRVN